MTRTDHLHGEWGLATRVGELIAEAGKHPVFLTKDFHAPDSGMYQRMAAVGAELRVCVSAFDTDAQLKHRFQTMLDYGDKSGLG